MSDSNDMSVPSPNVQRIEVDNAYEVRRWCQRLVCTEAQLRAAVAKVGADPAAVRAELSRPR